MAKLLLRSAARTFRFASVFALVVLANVAHAINVEVEGVAPISDKATGKARVFAIQNAIRQAAMQYSTQVSATTTMSNHTVTGDSARLRSNARVSNIAVADEWEEDGQYHVLIRAEIDTSAGGDSAAAGPRKKVAFMQLQVRDRSTGSDLPSLEIELSRMMRKYMEARAPVAAVDASQHILAETGKTVYEQNEIPARAVVVRTAQELGVQLLVSGVIVDTGISDDTVGRSRRFEVEFQLYDGISGTLVARSRYQEKVVGADRVKAGVGVASYEFLTSPYGRAITQVVQRSAAALNAELGQLPFSARVVRSNDKKVYLDVGSAALIRVGDVLLAYKVEGAPLTDPASGQVLGNPEQPVATLVVRSVQPQFSIGELETDQVTLKPGDIVRFSW